MSDKDKTIKQLLAEFNEIVDWFEGADLDLEKSVAQYNKATKIADGIKSKLGELKNEIDIKVVN